MCIPIVFREFRPYSGYIPRIPVIFRIFRLYSAYSGYIPRIPVIFRVFRLYSAYSGYIPRIPAIFRVFRVTHIPVYSIFESDLPFAAVTSNNKINENLLSFISQYTFTAM